MASKSISLTGEHSRMYANWQRYYLRSHRLSVGTSVFFITTQGTGWLWSADPDLEVVSIKLGTLPTLNSYKQIAFLAHGMGGLIVQRTLIKDTSLRNRVSHVALFGRPSARLAQVQPVAGEKMAQAAFVEQLRKDWTEEKLDSSPPFRFMTLAAERDQLVPTESSLGPFEKGTHSVVSGNHFSMFNAESREAPLISTIIQFIKAGTPTALSPEGTPGVVFISYSHGDTPEAARVRDSLQQSGFRVIFDLDDMAVGQTISQFIDKSVRNAAAVVSVVSPRSLLSSWVALETINSFEREKWEDRKLFIACTLTDEYLQPEFRRKCTDEIDVRIKRIADEIYQRGHKNIDSDDLNEEKSRLFELRNSLGRILARLKDSLCLDISEPVFDSSMKRLTAALGAKR